MTLLTAADVARICAGRTIGDARCPARALVVHSNRANDTAAFVALRDGRDGHNFVGDAFASGSPFAVVEDADALRGGPGVVVGDTFEALAALARDRRTTLRATVVGITGSVGKTTTKDLTAAAIGAGRRVSASLASYNNESGLPLTVINCPDDAEVLICEMGARRTGEIAKLCAIARPHAGIITGIGLAHLEVFGSREAIAATKSELLAALPPDGWAVVPSGDDYLGLMASSTAARVITAGPGGSVRPLHVALDDQGRAQAAVELPGGRRVRLRLPVPGRALVRNGLLALAAADLAGVGADAAAAAIAEARVSGSRMEIMRSGRLVIVNDCYNANPTSMASALATVHDIARGAELWAILGRMAEIAPVAAAEHARIGRLAAELGFHLVGVGEAAEMYRPGMPGLAAAATADEAAAIVAERAADGAHVLVKASRGASARPVLLPAVSRLAELAGGSGAGTTEEVVGADQDADAAPAGDVSSGRRRV